ncbi:D-alanine--poly(phosphoribitol) ligase subunit DltA [Candidatus Enterococcus murrayae]|uniref:D-alanine--D-alanyl carrier protein ligase n=1 Tax=Candidatus Enterococcus murrayae TaxID=2815321 RepID=A0ABS3HC27_9ENTE|nr:D-alanine--poly(phosphoribitol) ligase subunit DltA [Enterococcus sp. MJM16]MBO0451010.1 D-alanine--poly(phosphoribitol) ligase subunit DltA [Enterococcus sp. MJM16]
MQNIIEAIDKLASEKPEAVAYQSETETFSYQILRQWSNSLAYFLNQHVAAEKPIVVFGELEFEMIASFLGSVKSGHAYIPIESNTPLDRIQLILEVAQPAMILSVLPWPAEIPLEIPVLTPTDLAEVFNSEQEPIELQPVSEDETFYIIFTSGTTGVPKGVQISHKNLLSFTNWDLKDFGIKTGMRFLSQAPYSFDLSVMSVYPALCSGGTLVPVEKSVINDFKKLFEFLPKLALEVWVSTPSFIDICLMEKTFDGEHVPSLKIFQFCGEELTRKTAKELLTRFPNAKIFNTYGPTEATVAMTQIEVTDELLTTYDRVPIGYIKEDTEVLIYDGDQEVSEGEAGEIIIKGPSVSKGYMHNPEKTAAAFFEIDGVPAYHTGDAGRLHVDGLLLYEGRIDFQVKLHGFRIELEDIDHHLEKVSYVKQATVVPKYQNHKVQQLVAYVVVNDNDFEKAYQLTKAIKEELGEGVMEYMIPQKFIYVEHLPLTANGKIDRKRLINEVNS